MDSKTPFLHPELVFHCPLLMAALRVPYREHNIVLRIKHEPNNIEKLLTEMSEVFCRTLGSPDVEVVVVGYHKLELLASYLCEPLTMDSFRPDQDYRWTRVQMDLPFVVAKIAGTDVVACATKFQRYGDSNQADTHSQLAVFVSALARMLQVRRGLPTSQVVRMARDAIHARSTSLRLSSNIDWKGAGAAPTVLPVEDVLFPHRDTAIIRQELTLAGVQDIEVTPGVERSEAEQPGHRSRRRSRDGIDLAGQAPGRTLPAGGSHVVSTPRARDDTLFHARVQLLLGDSAKSDINDNRNTSFGSAIRGVWMASSNGATGQGPPSAIHADVIVDGARVKAVGVRAEHFMYVYLTGIYGAHFRPYQHWKSSARLEVLPGQRHLVDDSAGYDFVVDDAMGHFEAVVADEAGAEQQRSSRKPRGVVRCFIEVKGCAGPWDQVCHVSHNELNQRDIAASQGAAYLIAVVEFANDPPRTRLAAVVNWSRNREAFTLDAEAYKAALAPGAALGRGQPWLGPSTRAGSARPRALPEPSPASRAEGPRHKGVICKMTQNGYGFLSLTAQACHLREGGSVVVHNSQVQQPGLQLKVGLALSFELGSNPRGPHALNVEADAAAGQVPPTPHAASDTYRPPHQRERERVRRG